jgi:transcriptional regulator with PAS, ATPase and Fis domain
LIYGETGTGKELIASAIHYSSDRKKNDFVRINCAALPENLLESELFGHTKGAFTGASKDRKGRFQTASGGTVFLDEVGDTSPAFQAKLLRVLQEREIERVGDNRPIKINIRILAATNKNLLNLVKQNKFREDLYFRLSVVTIDLPPLRERQDDIPLLVKHILAELNAKSKNKVKGVVVDVIKLLMAYPWPGNIRELKNAIEHAFVFCKNAFIIKDDLPSYLKSIDVSDPIADDIELSQIPEQERIRKTLHLSRWNIKKAAEKMKMSRTTLWRKMKKLGIN